jgi:hypothetical protein
MFHLHYHICNLVPLFAGFMITFIVLALSQVVYNVAGELVCTVTASGEQQSRGGAVLLNLKLYSLFHN